jgi:chorismate mutase
MPVQSLQDLITLLDGPVPSLPEQPTEDDMTPWRQRIDALDRVILHLLNARATYANRIGQIKKTIGMPVYVPSREEEVLQNVTEGNPGPLPDDAVRRLFERVIDETRSLERHLFQDDYDTTEMTS